MVFHTIRSLLEIEAEKNVIIAINLYLKWCETKLVKEHTIETIAKFIEKEIKIMESSIMGCLNMCLLIMVGNRWQNLTLCIKTMESSIISLLHNGDIVIGKNIVKDSTQVNGHSLKLHFCIFKRSQRKHNSLDCHKRVSMQYNEPLQL